MSNTNITKEEIMAVFPKVAEIMADALGCEIERVKLEASLIDDLGAESIDFLDIVFRLERAFKVKIPRGKIVEEARGEPLRGRIRTRRRGHRRRRGTVEGVSERSAAGAVHFTAESGRHPAAVHDGDLLQDRDPSAAGGGRDRRQTGLTGLPPEAFRRMDAHFRAFSFVDRITAGPGRKANPRPSMPFPPGWQISRPRWRRGRRPIGRLGGDGSGGFQQPPVAGLAGRIELLSPVRPGQVLELAAQTSSRWTRRASHTGARRMWTELRSSGSQRLRRPDGAGGRVRRSRRRCGRGLHSCAGPGAQRRGLPRPARH